MNMMRRPLRLLIATVTYLSGIAPAARDDRLSLGHTFFNMPPPGFAHGWFTYYDHNLQPPVVYVADKTGAPVMTVSLRIPGAVRSVIRSTAASANGLVAIAGTSWDSEGRVGAFIAFLNQSGGLVNVVRTSPFGAHRLAFAADGTLWATGREVVPGERLERPHQVLRQFDQQGREVKKLLPMDSFQKYDWRHPADPAFLASTGRRVVFYSLAARELIILEDGGETITRFGQVELPTNGFVTGIAVSGGDTYISLQRKGKTSPGDAWLFLFDPSKKAWSPVLVQSMVTRPGVLLGSEGSSLALSDSLPAFGWVSAESLK